MAFYADEEEIWRCRRHPTKHRTSGVCPLCLRDRLSTLCPDCANVRPCACCPVSSTSSSSSSSSFSISSSSSSVSGVGATGRVSSLIDSEPAFRRSRSAAFQFLRRNSVNQEPYSRLPPAGNRSKSSFWSVFKTNKAIKNGEEVKIDEYVEEEAKKTKMIRSKSIGFSGGYSDSVGEVRLKGRSWYFPSPMKVFRQTKTAKVIQERSPLHRG